MAKKQATRLRKVTWDELSGVDDPANTERGWVVMKSFKKRQKQSAMRKLYKAIESIEEELPMEVIDAKDILKDYAGLLIGESSDTITVLDLDDEETRSRLLSELRNDVSDNSASILDMSIPADKLSPLAHAIRSDIDLLVDEEESDQVYNYVNEWFQEKEIPHRIGYEISSEDEPNDFVLKFVRKASERFIG